MIRKYWKKAVLIFVISILLEVLVFNFRALCSLTASHQPLEYMMDGNTLYATGMNGEPGCIYVGVNSYNEDGQQLPVGIKVELQDEGNFQYYALTQLTIYPVIEKSKYLQIHSYGEVKAMRITFDVDAATTLHMTDLIFDARVPWFLSVPRMLAVFGMLCAILCLRPGSGIYRWSWRRLQKRGAIAVLILINSMVFLMLVRSNPAFLQPVWPYHQQYHQLAVSLTQGKVSIDVGSEEMVAELKTLQNPYDYHLRQQMSTNSSQVWDTCYYQGNFYVYFGIVPVLLFYLPYYLIFQGAFPTWLGVFLAGVGIISGVYYLLEQIRRRWFPETPYVCYLLLALIGGNSLNLYCAMLHADFYYLPILLALCFTVWGLGIVLSVANDWNCGKSGKLNGKLAIGALCLALTAGCRPQFLVGSFLILPILIPLFIRDRKEKGILKRFIALAFPYLIVAASLMFYNYIRFGSVFDFGANYNLTTNDMTHRGMNLGRVPDGVFMYLFQPISFKLNFPFAEVVPFYSEYLGGTIRDWTFGGVLWTHPILWALLGLVVVRRELREKKLYGFTLLSICMAFVVVFADTQMAGILNRYTTDFLWLLMIPALIVLLQLLEKYKNADCCKWILCFLLIAGAWGIFYELAMAFRGSGIMNDNIHRYYIIKSFFQ